MTTTKSTAPDGKPLRSLARSRYAGGLVLAVALTALALSPLGDASTLLQDSFADGTRSRELTFPACPEGIVHFSQRLEFELPGDAHAWSTSLTATITVPSEASEGALQLYIGEGRNPDGTNNTLVGRGASVNLFSVIHYWQDLTGDLNEYLDEVGRTPATIRVPLTLYGCGVGGNLSVSVDGLAIVYSPGYGDNGQPVRTAPAPEVYLAAGGSEEDILDLADYFSDPDGDQFLFTMVGYGQETYVNGTLVGWSFANKISFAEVKLHNRSLVDVFSYDVTWRGDLFIGMCVNDIPGCEHAQNFRVFTLHIVDPPAPGMMPVAAHIFGPPEWKSAKAGSPSSLRVVGDGALPADATFVWYLDGTLSSTSSVFNGFAATEGSHVVKALVTTGGKTFVYQEAFTVGAPLPPQHVPTTPPRASLLLFSGAAFAVTGVALANSERGRFRLLWLVMAAVAPARKKASVVDHFVRGQIYQAIRDEPGVHFSEIVRRAGVGNGTAVYHLRLLEEAGLVRMVSDGTLTRLYPTDRPLDKRTYELHGRDRETLTAVEQLPGITQKALRSRLKRSASAVSRSVGRLAILGYVTVDSSRDGQKVFPRRDEEWPAVDLPSFATE